MQKSRRLFQAAHLAMLDGWGRWHVTVERDKKRQFCHTKCPQHPSSALYPQTGWADVDLHYKDVLHLGHACACQCKPCKFALNA